MTSLRTRLLAAASLVLALFVALCGAALERAFHQSALEAQYDKMQGLVYALLGASEHDGDGALTIPEFNLPDARLRQPQSGLDAALIDEQGRVVWRTPSFPELPLPALPDVGRFVFEYSEEPPYFLILFGIRWIAVAGAAQRYTVVVFEDTRAFRAQLNAFRGTLWLALALSTAVLLASLLAVLALGLRPLRGLTRQLHRIEEGGQARIEGRFPQELEPLAQSLNAMIAAERNQQTRYRNALGDLAHSLKTPLAVLRGVVEEAVLPPALREQLDEQTRRMQHIVDYRLRRAAAAGSRTLSEPVELRPLADKIASAISKVYDHKGLQISNRIPSGMKLRADQGDLYEIFGNLLDNAAKYGRRQAAVTVARVDQRLQIVVEDDGPGFPADADKLLARGVRADSLTPGQGIGLSTVAEIVRAYEGRIELGRSALGGGQVVVTL
jgi:two-component system, OmpR family, sensor histidine kinase PhoQ